MAKVGFNGQWIEIARIGKAVDSLGVDRDLTPDWIEQVIANYAAGPHEAPVVLGHPDSDSAPAFGWASDIRLNGDVLEARFADTNDEFERAVARGEYKKRSASFYLNPPNLRHVGFLGAQPPAIKGLRDIQFAEGDNFAVETFNLQEKKMEETDLDQLPESFWKKFKSKLLGVGEKADLSEAGKTPAAAQTPTAFSAADVRSMIDAAVGAVKADFTETLTKLETANTELQAKIDGQIAGGVRSDIAQFVENIPADKGKHFLKNIGVGPWLESLAVADAKDEKKAVCFSEGTGDDETTHEFSRFEFAKELISSLPPMIQFGEKFGNIVATKEADAMINNDRVNAMKNAAGVKTEGGKA